MKYLIIYHDNCIDGITSATVAHKHLTEVQKISHNDITYWPASYDDDITPIIQALDVLSSPVLYIVDFSFSVEQLKKLDLHAHYVHLYDHHASAFRNLLGADYNVQPDSREIFTIPMTNVAVTLDNSECGASLCWRELIDRKGIFPRLISFVKDYDLWKFLLLDTKAINKFLRLQPKTIYCFSYLLETFERSAEVMEAAATGEAIMEYEHQLEASIISQGTSPITIGGMSGLAVNAPYALASSIGNTLAKESGTFGAVWSQLAEGKVCFSLRSVGDNCDVSKIAELLGGGGHKNAAGFTMNSPDYDADKGMTIWHNLPVGKEE